jgi:two-component system, OmpR family, phosphate regulon sensor histidine kinase PhoR
VDSIIQTELRASSIDLKYNFDFCNTYSEVIHDENDGGTFTKNLNKALPRSGIIMHLEFPGKSNYILKQIGPAFISSILIILLISIMFIITFRFYNREKRNAERTRGFLNNMTHEFKTPLANIAFANNMLARESDAMTPDKIRKYTHIIRCENEKMVDSSEDILEMAKQEFDFAKLSLENVDVHDLIYGLQSSFRASNTALDPHFTLNLSAKFFTVKGKTSFLQNALSNLIDNAIKYCRTNPRITISTFNEKGVLCISIEDNGIGIHKKELESIFEKFYRVSTGDLHDVKGFGLGLSYVKMVIQQMKGSIAVESDINKGSVFTIKLPVTDD